MLRRLFRWYLSKLGRFDVGDGRGDVFFTRYDVLKTRFGSAYLHEFHRSDKDQCLHDHPWSFLAIILRTGYWEELVNGYPYVLTMNLGTIRTPNKKVWRTPFVPRRYAATHAHRIEIDPSRPKPWSLVFVGPKRRDWGFLGPIGWIKWTPGSGNPICENLS